MRRTTWIYAESLKIVEIKGVEQLNFSPKRPTILEISDMKPWNLLFWKHCPTHINSCESHKWLKVPFCHFHLSQNEWYEWIYDWTVCFWRTPESHYPLLSWCIYCCVIEHNWSFKYKILSRVDPLGTNLIFLSPLGLLKFQGFLSFLSILKWSYSKPFYSTLSYASTANIQ